MPKAVTQVVFIQAFVQSNRHGIEITPGEPAVALVEHMTKLSNLQFAGIQSYAGFAAHVNGFEARKKASEEAKCNVCHFGNSKKNKNDYGKALGELLKKDNYKEDRVKAEPEAVKKELEEAFKKVEAAKSKGGDTFGDRLKAGKLPGSPE